MVTRISLSYLLGLWDYFQCPKCSRRFNQPVSASRHMSKCMKKNLSGNDRKMYKCDKCCSSFSTPGYLLCHIKVIHLNISKYRCTFCNKGFANALVLQSHTRTHTGDKPFICTTCNKAFAQKGSLERHKKTHFKKKS